MKSFSISLLKTGLLFVFLLIPFAYANITRQAGGETPASLACIYGLTPHVAGCPINGTSAVPNTGSGAIAIIDGQDDPNAFNELTQFSNQFPPMTVLNQCNSNNSNSPCFQQYYVRSPFNANDPCVIAQNNASTYNISPTTDIEPELDIEWAHAMAPKANIYMVETQGWGDGSPPNLTSLIHGIQCATHLLLQYHGGGIISYSHSFPEWSGETAYDSNFQTPGIIYIMSSGDYSAPANYPASSPFVVAAGGTSIVRDSSGNYIGQVAWHDNNPNDCNSQGVCKTGGSGGPSLYEPRPTYQNSVQKIVGNMRGTPDISFAAEGIEVFCCQLSAPGNNCCGGAGKPCQSLPSICTTGTKQGLDGHYFWQ
jgi:kumamolisin